MIGAFGGLELAGAFGAGATLGFVFGLLGGGGNLFLVPLLVLGFGLPVSRATGTALVVVFLAAVSAAIGHARKGRLRPRPALQFGAFAVLGATTGALVHPLASEAVVLRVLAAALVIAGARMLIGPAPSPEALRPPASLPHLALMGFVAGGLAGFAGVGGGFIIVPTLYWWGGMALHQAIGTSAAVIAANGLTGALVHLSQGTVEPALAVPLGLGAIVGSQLGAPLSGRLPERPLRVAFASVVALAALLLLARSFA